MPEENDKPTVIALREIEEGLITTDIMDQLENHDSIKQEAAEQEAISFLTEMSNEA